ncbi:hypothetical protein SGRIM119S_03953 [Streptomyces griseorubiginosus]
MAGQYLDGYARILAEVSATGRRLTREEIESRRALGERAAEAGYGLRAVVVAHLAAARAAWPDVPGSADNTLAAVQQVIDAFAEGHERAQRQAVYGKRRPPGGSSSTTSSTAAATWAASPNALNASVCACPTPTRSPSHRARRPTTRATPCRGRWNRP